MHIYKTAIKMHHTDAAQVIFFANQFQIAHDAYEDMLQKNGLLYADFFKRGFGVPIVHAETNYQAPLRVSDEIIVEMVVEKIGDSSFTLAHTFKKADGTLTGQGKTVHVCVHMEREEKISIPDDLRALLKNI